MKEKVKSSKKIKLGFVSDAIYPYNKGGKEKRLFEITTRLAKENFDVTIYCMKWWKGKEIERIEDGVKLHAISPYFPLYANNKRSFSQAIFFMLHCFKLLKKDFDILDVDHMPHLVLFSTKIVCLLKGKKMIGSWNEVWGRKYWMQYAGPIMGSIAYIVEITSVKLPNVLLSISPHTTEKLKNELQVTQQIFTVPLGVDQAVITKTPAAKQKYDCMYAGRLLAHKNVSTLIQAMSIMKKKNPKISCLIVGEGPEKPNLKKLVQNLKLEKNITFLDFITEETGLYAQMKSAQVFVLPSLREGFGLVVIEANACNIPVVVIDHKDNASKNLVKNGENGYVAQNSPQSMEKGITKLLSLTKKDYKQYVNKYDWENVIKDLKPIYSL